jgi:hypothetical protein
MHLSSSLIGTVHGLDSSRKEKNKPLSPHPKIKKERKYKLITKQI